MSKIKLTNFPYQDHVVGEVCDFGEEKNASLVSMQRAVLYDPIEIKRRAKKAERARIRALKPIEEVKVEKLEAKKVEDQPVIEVTKPAEEKPQEPKEKPETKKSKKFWDMLK